MSWVVIKPGSWPSVYCWARKDATAALNSRKKRGIKGECVRKASEAGYEIVRSDYYQKMNRRYRVLGSLMDIVRYLRSENP